MILTERIVTIRKGVSTINAPIHLYRGDYEIEVRFVILNSKFLFRNTTNLIETNNACFGQLAILKPDGDNIFSNVEPCVDGTVSFVITKTMADELSEIGEYSFHIRLYDENQVSRVSIPPVQNGIVITEPIASEDHTNVVGEAIAGYALANTGWVDDSAVEPFDDEGNYNQKEWIIGDKITTGAMNKIESAINTINSNTNVAELNDRMSSNYNVLQTQIDNIILESGNTDAEVVQARGNYELLNQRLNAMDETDAELVSQLEGVNSQLAHVANYKNNLLNIFEYNKCDDVNCNGNCGKVKGDGIHDDTLGLQNAIDYCWDNNIGGVYLPIPIEHYTTTSPLHLWGSSSESVRKKVALVGDGKELTKIVKITNTCSNLNNHTNIDAVLILANDYIKNNNSLQEEIDTSGLGICRYTEVSGISLSCVSSSNRVKYGIYSVGWFFARFTDVQFENVDTGMNTLTWNCYSTYDRLRFNRTLNGCDFGTSQVGGQTTMLFQDCHANGVDGCVFSIRGNATFINCAIDGGGGTHYKAQTNYRSGIGWDSAKIVLINCHHESPSVFENNHLFDLTHAEAYVYTSAMEIPVYNFTPTSSVIKISKGSTFVLNDTNIGFRLGVENCPGMLVDKDVSSRFVLNNSFIDTEMFDVYKHCVYSESDCIVLSNRVINTPIVKGVSYITSTVPTQNIPIPSVERTDTRLVFSSSNNVDSVDYTAAYIFTKKVDLTNMTKINVLGDIDLGDVSGTNLGNFKITLFEELPQDDFCYRGTPLSSYLSQNTQDYNDYSASSTNYSRQNANKFIDITDVIGEYYVGISISSRNATASIKEVKIIR